MSKKMFEGMSWGDIFFFIYTVAIFFAGFWFGMGCERKMQEAGKKSTKEIIEESLKEGSWPDPLNDPAAYDLIHPHPFKDLWNELKRARKRGKRGKK